MKRSLLLYVGLVTVIAAVVAALILVEYPIGIRGIEPWLAVGALMLLSLVAEGFGVRMGSGGAVFTVSLIPLVTTVPLFGPAVAVVTTAVTQALARTAIQRQPTIKAIFNVSQLTIVIGLGSVVYLSLNGPIVYVAGFDVVRVGIALGGLIVTYFVVNMALVSVVISLDTGKQIGSIWRQLAPVAFANDLASSSFSLFVVFAFAQFQIYGLLVVLLPLFFVQHALGIQHKLLKQNKEVLELLVKTIEAKDPYTSGHSLRVASLSRGLAEAMGMPPHKVEEVETAALLHDIGKIDVAYNELISSPARLTELEKEIIRSHPDRGARLLTSLSSMSNTVLSAIRHHHEHYDGNGYPDGLVGEEIPIAARIIMVVDTVDAMLSNRPYRAALTPEDVVAELRRFAGRQFDPTVAAKFIELKMVDRASHRAEMDRTPLPLARPVPVPARVSVS